MKRLVSLIVVLTLAPAMSVADDSTDVRGGMLDDGYYESPEDEAWGLNDPGTDRITPERKPRFAGKYKNGENRDPRKSVYRQISDPIIDVFVGGRKGSVLKTTIGTAQNINEAVEMKQRRIEENEIPADLTSELTSPQPMVSPVEPEEASESESSIYDKYR